MLHDKTANITLNACAHYLAKLKKTTLWQFVDVNTTTFW